MKSTRQNLFYIFNTSFLVLIAFIAGYNLKSREIQTEINNTAKSAEQFIQETEENHIKSERLLADVEITGKNHFEGIAAKFPTESQVEVIVKSEAKSVTPLKIISLPASKAEAPAATKERKTVQSPQQIIPSVNISHTIKKGESLSALVKKAAMADFLKSNPQISNPDRIYPGQKVMIKIPKQSILTGSYLNNYFVHSLTNSTGETTYVLRKSFSISESETLLIHIMNQTRLHIGKSTTPYINLADFTNTMKEEIWGEKAAIRTRGIKISNIAITQTGVHFTTVNSHPIFNINHYQGINSAKAHDYFEHIDLIKDYLIKHLASIQPEKPGGVLFHFMIFGETIVQTNFIEAAAYNDISEKSKIAIGLVYINNQTQSTLFKLQRALSTCKLTKGGMVELSQENLIQFKEYSY